MSEGRRLSREEMRERLGTEYRPFMCAAVVYADAQHRSWAYEADVEAWLEATEGLDRRANYAFFRRWMAGPLRFSAKAWREEQAREV